MYLTTLHELKKLPVKEKTEITLRAQGVLWSKGFVMGFFF